MAKNRDNHIGLYHPLDGLTNPKYRLLHFLATKFFCKEKMALAFNRGRYCYLALCLWLILFHSDNAGGIFSHQESISPTHLCSAQRHQHKVKGAKDAVLFHQHFCHNCLHFLGYSFWAICHILAHFHLTLLPLKALKMMCAKAPLLWC
jgi:hypothetical protein